MLPCESRSAKDGGIGLLEGSVDEFHLVLPERKEVLVHCPEDRFSEELLVSCKTAEEDDCLRSGEVHEIGKRLAQKGSGVIEYPDREFVTLPCGIIDVLCGNLVELAQE